MSAFDIASADEIIALLDRAPRNRGKVKDDRVIPSLCGRHSPWKGVSIICVEKNGDIDLLTQNSHERRDVTNSHKQFAVMR